MEDDSFDHENAHDATSELGCNQLPQRRLADPDTDEKWFRLLDQQNRNFMAIVQAMNGRPNTHKLQFPEFDPDKENVDARAWISTADMCVSDQQLSGAPLMLALSAALKGQASAWLAQVSYQGMCWKDFKKLFISRYDCPETAAAHLINLHASKPKDDECLAAYAATLMTSLMTKWKDLTVEQIAVATVMSHISQFEPRVQKLSFTHDISSRNRLQQELKAVSFLKRKSPTTANDKASDAKRYKETPIMCYTCGKPGHKTLQCRYRSDFIRPSNKPFSPSSDQKPESSQNKIVPPKTLTCFNCRGNGHYASECPKRRSQNAASSSGSSSSGGSGNSQPNEKRVDVCALSSPTG